MEDIGDVGDFALGIVLGFLLIMFLFELIIFTAFNEPNSFGKTYKDFFCNGLKT